jgi:putative copper resistance protein D
VANLLDMFAFLAVLLRGVALALQTLILGGIIFTFAVVRPLSVPFDSVADRIRSSCRQVVTWSALALALTQLLFLSIDSAVLIQTAGMNLNEVVSANFFLVGSTTALAALMVAALGRTERQWRSWGLLTLGMIILSASVLTSHAAGRLEHRLPLALATAMHQAATASWIGGIPYLVLSLSRCSDIQTARTLSERFSRLALVSVAILAAAGVALSLAYVHSVDALYGTSYGLMVVSKAVLLGLLLILGGLNFRIVRRLQAGDSTLLVCLRRFAEVEVGIGFTVIFAAASLTSQPPAVDLIVDRANAGEVLQRIIPRWPTLTTPVLGELAPATPLTFSDDKSPVLASYVPGALPHTSGPADIAWSEYNHHWAGLIVLTIGLLAVLVSTGRAPPARHWPLLFLGLAAFLLVRSDPENWPLGPRGFWESFVVAEVLQHRVFVLLVVAFALFEWRVQTNRVAARSTALVFPAVCALGGALLLTHSHSLANAKEELLTELSHIPLALFAILAGWSRWLELRLSNKYRYIPARIWPVCFVLIGTVLLLYRES